MYRKGDGIFVVEPLIRQKAKKFNINGLVKTKFFALNCFYENIRNFAARMVSLESFKKLT